HDYQDEGAPVQPPIRLEEALFSGRTEAFVPHAEATETVELCYRDVVSFSCTVYYTKSIFYYNYHHFPFRCRSTRLSTSLTSTLSGTRFTTPSLIYWMRLARYFGIAEVSILPPTNLHIPLLPAKISKKLVFGLCRVCMETQCSSECTHTDAERMLRGTWSTPELHKALQLGYMPQSVHALAYWAETRSGLFADYVNTFLKLKAESSGSPGMTEDAKAAYMASFFEREGVRLEKVEENPGLRFVAKIFLNSLWGKFCQRDDLTSTEIVDSYEAWLQRLTDPSIKVKSCEPVGESFMMLEFKPRIGGAGERAFKYANVLIGVFTTSHARLRPYEALEGLGTRVIYADTDSVVYRCSPGQYEPPGGSSLGQWTDEATNCR
uniref:DNA-directed DNA polymerase n=1 Tax=Macrostomum lignano TaxID=282301 RepID=A0A1I8GJN6_9PLAT